MLKIIELKQGPEKGFFMYKYMYVWYVFIYIYEMKSN